MSRVARRIILASLLLVVVLGAAAVMTARTFLLESLPATSGSITLAGLTAPVTIQRDGLSIPTITGASFLDVARAQGFITAQDRFFQMDLARRYAAGRLAEIGGSAVLPIDRRLRAHQFQQRADDILPTLPEHHRRALEAYADGVNAGLAALGARPPEYLALRISPEPWRPADSLLVGFFMFDALSMGAPMERSRDAVRAALGDQWDAFLHPETSRWDTPLDAPQGDPHGPSPIPGPELLDLRAAAPAPATTGARAWRDEELDQRAATGSNSWAVAGSRTAHGGAILANDMHLGISAPGPWYRVALAWAGRSATGVSLPGVPGLIVGSTRDIAWGFTNVCGDFEDYILIETLPDDPTRYRIPGGGSEPFTTTTHELKVRGSESVFLTLRHTRWGAVTQDDHAGRPLVLKWIATEPDPLNVALLDMLDAQRLEEALEIAARWRGPPQNVTVADANGRIGWTISGMIPERSGFDGAHPVAWTDAALGWTGALVPDARPRIIDPASGHIVTANHRTLDLPRSRAIGRNWSSSIRARRITERLEQGSTVTERDMLALQLDTRAELLESLRDHALTALPPGDAHPETDRIRRALTDWNGHADADQIGYTILKAFAARVEDAVTGPVHEHVRSKAPAYRYAWFMRDEPIRRLIDEQPDHLLNPRYESWTDLLRTNLIAAATQSWYARSTGRPLDTPWGQANRARIAHPLVRNLRINVPFLTVASHEQPGDFITVRVTGPAYGASQRLVVSPGRSDTAILHIPAGQSGHPLSRHFTSSHRDWRQGSPSPLNPGQTVSTLTLTP